MCFEKKLFAENKQTEIIFHPNIMRGELSIQCVGCAFQQINIFEIK